MSDDEELGRLLAAAPRIEEPVVRLLERLQTGWQPTRAEIDPVIRQRSTWTASGCRRARTGMGHPPEVALGVVNGAIRHAVYRSNVAARTRNWSRCIN